MIEESLGRDGKQRGWIEEQVYEVREALQDGGFPNSDM
jgi:hypothetical protein